MQQNADTRPPSGAPDRKSLPSRKAIAHSPDFLRRRFWNWFPLGLTYAFLYMGRYNLTVSKNAFGDVMSKEAFGTIFGIGAWVYALAFLVNGPLTDRIGGKRSILLAAAGSALMNLLMGAVVWLGWTEHLLPAYAVLYAANMYFQSFGALAIVKVNAAWFHVTERGQFSGIFGVLISLGLYFAFDWGNAIVNAAPGAIWWVFWIPAAILLTLSALESILLRDRPSQAGHADFDTGDASSGEGEGQIPVGELLRRVLGNPIILTIGMIEFCTGVLRNGVMHWFPIYAKEELGLAANHFLRGNWGLLLCVAGITGGLLAGVASDRLFQSRRAPAAGFLYGSMVVAAIGMIFSLHQPWVLGALVFWMSLCVIGTHGLLSGTATMDFGGRKAAATAVGLIDGLVYLGTGLQSIALGYLTTKSWDYWPMFLVPFAIAGTLLAARIWHAKPQPKGQPEEEPKTLSTEAEPVPTA